ncbi:hypothetical protein ABK040_009459 [Willaertia magna]
MINSSADNSTSGNTNSNHSNNNTNNYKTCVICNKIDTGNKYISYTINEANIEQYKNCFPNVNLHIGDGVCKNCYAKKYKYVTGCSINKVKRKKKSVPTNDHTTSIGNNQHPQHHLPSLSAVQESGIQFIPNNSNVRTENARIKTTNQPLFTLNNAPNHTTTITASGESYPNHTTTLSYSSQSFPPSSFNSNATTLKRKSSSPPSSYYFNHPNATMSAATSSNQSSNSSSGSNNTSPRLYNNNNNVISTPNTPTNNNSGYYLLPPPILSSSSSNLNDFTKSNNRSAFNTLFNYQYNNDNTFGSNLPNLNGEVLIGTTSNTNFKLPSIKDLLDNTYIEITVIYLYNNNEIFKTRMKLLQNDNYFYIKDKIFNNIKEQYDRNQFLNIIEPIRLKKGITGEWIALNQNNNINIGLEENDVLIVNVVFQ